MPKLRIQFQKIKNGDIQTTKKPYPIKWVENLRN
jgi:hypothetical protein